MSCGNKIVYYCLLYHVCFLPFEIMFSARRVRYMQTSLLVTIDVNS